ncbi:hypothetical protein Leryth_010928 [Lithospermum erythrorhizon]|nr:hypothetical protein Leryth_010928 [Lithospermum erythrorhizon]
MALWIEELNVPLLDIEVSIHNKTTILPAGSIPVSHGDTLYLSNLDDMIGTRVFTPTTLFPIDSAILSLSGRLRETGNGKLEVFFGPDQGVLFIEASTEMELESLGDLSVPNPAYISLIFEFPNEEPYKLIDMPLLIAQVTQFSCGGFSLGLRICHCPT